jgi:hypothetical protein
LFGIGVLVFLVGFGVKDVGLERDEQEADTDLEPIDEDLEEYDSRRIEMEVPKGTA